MKHVWILNHYAQLPSESGGMMRHHALARYLPANGWRASIVAASTRHPSGRQREGMAEDGTDVVDGIPFLWLRTPGYSGNGGDRIRNMLAYGWRAAFSGAMSSLDKPDVIVGSSPHPVCALAAALLARRHGVPFVFEVRDLWPQTLIAMGRIAPHHPAAITMRRLEKLLYRSARRIIVLPPRAGDYIVPLGIAPEKIVWIPNGIEPGLYPTAPASAPADRFTLMYSGSH